MLYDKVMIKMNSISGIVCYSKDLGKTAKFYKDLGFVVTKDEPDQFCIRLNWFWVEFINTPAHAKPIGTVGQFIYITVNDVDKFYQAITAQGFKFDTDPVTYESGRREAMLTDPDGYRLVFFSKK